jgi:thioredoxin-like negative regulator of GroEL
LKWFDQWFGTAPTVSDKDKKTAKKDKSSKTKDKNCISTCCKSEETETEADSSAVDALFETTNKINLKEGMDFDTLIASEHLTCVKFTASWCKPCQQQEPEMVRLAATMAEAHSSMRFVSVDVDDHDSLFASLEIIGIPHTRLYQNSKMLESFTGNSIGDLEKACERLVKKTK